MVTSSGTSRVERCVIRVKVTFDLLNSVIFDDLWFAHDLHRVDLFVMDRTDLYHIPEGSSSDDIDHLERSRAACCCSPERVRVLLRNPLRLFCLWWRIPAGKELRAREQGSWCSSVDRDFSGRMSDTCVVIDSGKHLSACPVEVREECCCSTGRRRLGIAAKRKIMMDEEN